MEAEHGHHEGHDNVVHGVVEFAVENLNEPPVSRGALLNVELVELSTSLHERRHFVVEGVRGRVRPRSRLDELLIDEENLLEEGALNNLVDDLFERVGGDYADVRLCPVACAILAYEVGVRREAYVAPNILHDVARHKGRIPLDAEHDAHIGKLGAEFQYMLLDELAVELRTRGCARKSGRAGERESERERLANRARHPLTIYSSRLCA